MDATVECFGVGGSLFASRMENTYPISRFGDSVQKNATAREQADKARWERLRTSKEEAPPSAPAGYLEAPPAETTLENGDAYYLDGDVLRTGMPVDFSTAEDSLVHALRDLRKGPKFFIRRGRQTPGRGDCPVSGNEGVIPGGRPPAPISAAPRELLSLQWNLNIMPNVIFGPVGLTKDEL
ncbi:hypothetical protein PC121_g13822 [Phytophthora cactorum]|nr:hypothetical protein PC120_g14561 [Phytophthora cactorum]KAG3059703.1 hypothetical protein PC121_g13822 [Phytophthora cactorum]KAG4052374.1 hypothetical protein PC123_g12441 [Phytophthora cactorum]